MLIHPWPCPCLIAAILLAALSKGIGLIIAQWLVVCLCLKMGYTTTIVYSSHKESDAELSNLGVPKLQAIPLFCWALQRVPAWGQHDQHQQPLNMTKSQGCSSVRRIVGPLISGPNHQQRKKTWCVHHISATPAISAISAQGLAVEAVQPQTGLGPRYCSAPDHSTELDSPELLGISPVTLWLFNHHGISWYITFNHI